MTRDEAIEAVRPCLPTLPGVPDHCHVSVPLGALRALLRDPGLGITPLADLEVAEVLERGRAKHAGHLTEETPGPIPELRDGHLAALKRHIEAYEAGQRWDPETDLRTSGHIAARGNLFCETDLRAS